MCTRISVFAVIIRIILLFYAGSYLYIGNMLSENEIQQKVTQNFIEIFVMENFFESTIYKL